LVKKFVLGSLKSLVFKKITGLQVLDPGQESAKSRIPDPYADL
jgi:hypothetical protein